MDILKKYNYYIYSPCGGRGLCEKCKVLIIERENTILRKELKLACLYRVQSNIDVYLEDENSASIMTHLIKTNYKADNIYSNKEVNSAYGIAFDIGTTTVVGYLVDLKNGKVLDYVSDMNKQSLYGGDVISRITFVIENSNKKDVLRNISINQLRNMILKLTNKNLISTLDLKRISIVGNTTMLHFLMGYDVLGLAKAPFKPVNLDGVVINAYDLGIFKDIKFKDLQVSLLPCISTYVGADVVAATLSCGIINKQKLSLLVDIGTNTEIVLGNSEFLYTCSTAAGPAFEGATIKHGMAAIRGAINNVSIKNGIVKIETIENVEPKGICGSGIIDAISGMLDENIVDRSGRLNIDDGEFVIYNNNENNKIVITAEDIRQIQLAKASIAAGIKVLFKKANLKLEDVDRVYISGGFGNYVNIESAINIGLFPKEFVDKFISVKNAALSGAIAYLISNKARRDTINIVNKSSNIDLSGSLEFYDEYINNMFF